MSPNRYSQKSQLTSFQRRVYNALLKIPRGKVTTYKILARYLKCRSCQAVGQALRRNPFAPKVPCHRVIASNLSLGGFSATGGLACNGQGYRKRKNIKRKLQLLADEGLKFENGRLANPDLIYRF